jgi:hypothetical protein
VNAVETKADAQVLTRELLASRLFHLFLLADEQGYTFSRGELRALMDVRRWPTGRLQTAAEYYERITKDDTP